MSELRSRLDELVGDHQWRALASLLGALSDAEVADARAWYRRSGRKAARSEAQRYGFAGDETRSPSLCAYLLALSLPESPSEAITCLEWGRLWWPVDAEVGLPALVASLLRRDATWCAEFVEQLADREFVGEASRQTAWAACLMVPLVAHLGLPVPSGATYVGGWARLVESWANYRDPRWPNSRYRPSVPPRVAASGRVSAAPIPDTLDEALTTAPEPVLTLRAVFVTPDAAASLASGKHPEWQLDESVRRLHGGDAEARQALLDGVVASLSRPDSVSAQRAAASVIEGLGLTPEEVGDQVPMLLSLLPVVHGAVTAVLLPVLFSATLSPEDLAEVGAVVLARKEKAQKAFLLGHLIRLKDRDLASVAEELLSVMAEGADAALAAKARKALAEQFGPAKQEPTQTPPAVRAPDLWSVEPPAHDDTGPFDAPLATEQGLTALWSQCQSWQRTTDNAAWLDLAVRFAAVDLPRAKHSFAALQDVSRWIHPRALVLLVQWAQGGEPTWSYLSTWTTTVNSDGDSSVSTRTMVQEPGVHARLTDRLTEETISRLGTMRALLSTPDADDGTLSVAGFVANARAAKADSFGPYDLVQAMLRLRVSPGDEAKLRGVRLGPRFEDRPRARVGRMVSRRLFSQPGDGVDIVRAWVAAGGLPPADCVVVDGRIDWPGTVPPRIGPALPELEEHLALLEPVSGESVRQPDYSGRVYTNALGVAPTLAEALVATVEKSTPLDGAEPPKRVNLLVHSAHVGSGVLWHLAGQICHPRADARSRVAESIACLMGQGRFDPATFASHSVTQFEAGRLSLKRAADGWEQVILAGGMRLLWPTVTAVAAAAADAPKKPAGLADLFRMMRPYAPADPTGPDGVPPSIRALAGQRGSTKAHVECRELVAAWTVPGHGGAAS